MSPIRVAATTGLHEESDRRNETLKLCYRLLYIFT